MIFGLIMFGNTDYRNICSAPFLITAGKKN